MSRSWTNVLSGEQLARILDANPERIWEIQTGNWNVEQSVVMANRSGAYLHLRLSSSPRKSGSGVSFQDHKVMPFVQALQQRQSSFGSLAFMFERFPLPMSDDNILQLLQLEHVFDEITLVRLPEECFLLPFSAKVNSMEYFIKVQFLPRPYFRYDPFHSLDIIVPKQKSTSILFSMV